MKHFFESAEWRGSCEATSNGSAKQYDKRQDIAKKDMRREAERDFKVKNLY